MDGLLSAIGGLTAPWADLYGSSATLGTLVMFLHLGGTVAAGGLAVTLDQAVLRSGGDGWPLRPDLARILHRSHGAVIGGLGVVFLSGLLLTASDPEWFLVSPLYWAKMAAVALLLLNGWFLKRAGDRLREEPDDPDAFRSLRRSALRSGALWALTLLVGVAMTMYL